MKKAESSPVHNVNIFDLKVVLIALNAKPIECSYVVYQLHPTLIRIFGDLLLMLLLLLLRIIQKGLQKALRVLFLPIIGIHVSVDLVIKGIGTTSQPAAEHDDTAKTVS